MRRFVQPLGVVMLACVCVALSANWSFSEDKKPGEMQLPPGMTAEQMQKMMELATPGPQHAALKAMAGTFNTEMVCLMPGAPEDKSTGKAVNDLVLGGRYLRQQFEGTTGGQPFQGIGFTGYDNFKKKYVGTWMDTMSTSMLNFEGTVDSSGKVITASATYDCPINMKPVTCKMVTTIVSNDKHTFEMNMPMPDGKESKMTITYTRVK